MEIVGKYIDKKKICSLLGGGGLIPNRGGGWGVKSCFFFCQCKNRNECSYTASRINAS